MQVGINVGGIKLENQEVLKRVVEAMESVNREFGDCIALSNVKEVSKYRVGFQLVPFVTEDYRTDTFRRIGFQVQNLHATCYHGYLAFMVELFRDNPETILRSAVMSYDGVADFIENAPKVAGKNIGPVISPIPYESLCWCDWNERDSATDSFDTLTTD